MSLVLNSFLKEEVKAILGIPSSLSHLDDYILWHYEKSGNYSVRSGYRVGLNMGCVPSLASLSGSV